MRTSKKQATYLPLFSGFYNTIWQADESNFLYSEGLDYDDIEVDYSEYEKDIVSEFCDKLPEYISDFVKSIELEQIVSPREYNFRNDSANVIIEFYPFAIRAYIKANRENFQKYLDETYTSRSGFISFHSNHFEDWKDATDNFTDFSGNEHYLGSVLDFICSNGIVTEENLYYDIETYIDNYITVKHSTIDSLDDYDLEQAAFNSIDLVDFSFGYISILKQVCIEKANVFEHLGETWQTVFCHDYPKEILAAAKVDKVKTETLEPVKN